MEFIKYNKGLIMFYLCIVLFTMFSVSNVERINDKVMEQKRAYMLNERGY